MKRILFICALVAAVLLYVPVWVAMSIGGF
jgi:quinol-cytochrome oxidoreductase complex cytochrome b subunit